MTYLEAYVRMQTAPTIPPRNVRCPIVRCVTTHFRSTTLQELSDAERFTWKCVSNSKYGKFAK